MLDQLDGDTTSELFWNKIPIWYFWETKIDECGICKAKIFDSSQSNETNIQGQSLRFRQIVWLCLCMLVSLDLTGSKRFCFTNPVFINFSLPKVQKSGPCFKKVLSLYMHLWTGKTLWCLVLRKTFLLCNLHQNLVFDQIFYPIKPQRRLH